MCYINVLNQRSGYRQPVAADLDGFADGRRYLIRAAEGFLRIVEEGDDHAGGLVEIAVGGKDQLGDQGVHR